jgi:hypothetical protein
MMEDAEFQILQIKAAVCPSKEAWPSGELKPSILGDKPTWGGDPTWNALHTAVDDARDRVTQCFAKISAVDDDMTLSREGKTLKKAEIAEAALDGLKKSTTLTKARESVQRQVAKWDAQAGLTPKAAATPEEGALLSEIRQHVASLKGPGRVNFIVQNAHDPRVVQSVLGAPAFLSGLSDADVGVVKDQVVKRNAPEIFEKRNETTKALADVEQGWRNAATQIASRGGLPKPSNGGAAA